MSTNIKSKNDDEVQEPNDEVKKPDEEQTPETKTADLNDLVNDMPDVVPEAVQAEQEKSQTEEHNQYAHLTDRYGRAFDPNIHKVGLDGKPVLTRDGNLRIGAGRKSNNQSNINLPPEQAQQHAEEQRNRRYFAEVTSNMFIQTGVAIFGDDWQPEKTKDFDEKENLVNVTDDYFKHAGIIEPPPWAVLVIAYGAYGLRRMDKPKVRTGMQRLGDGFKKLMGKAIRIFKRRKKGVDKNARSNSRDNGNGKDHVSVQIGGDVQTKGDADTGTRSRQTE